MKSGCTKSKITLIKKAEDEQDHTCFTSCMFNKKYNCTCLSFCSERTLTEEAGKEKNKPVIIYEDTILFTYQGILDRAYKDLDELLTLNQYFRGKYTEQIERAKDRTVRYEKLIGEAFKEITSEYKIRRRAEIEAN